MSSFIETLYQHTLLADAAYLIHDQGQVPPPLSIDDQLRDRGFTDEQISKFNIRYDVVDFQPNADSGFAATIYTDTTTNKQILTIRGTEANTIADLFAGFDIALFGQATGQYAALKHRINGVRLD